MRCMSNACVAINADVAFSGVCRPIEFFKNTDPCFLLELISSCESGYCRLEDSKCGDPDVADKAMADLVEGATKLLNGANDLLKLIGIDLEAIGEALVKIGSDIEDLFDKKAKARKEQEKLDKEKAAEEKEK